MTQCVEQVVVIIDDEPDVLMAHIQSLEIAGLRVRGFERAEDALDFVKEDFDGVIVSDIRMPGMDGLELFRRLKELDADLPVILVSGHADIATAVNAVRLGAYDFLSKPFIPDQLVMSARRALERRRLILENRRLREGSLAASEDGPLLGSSQSIVALRRMIAQLADTDIDVLIEGETGTGKSLVANILHDRSSRSRRAMIAVDCGALPDSMLDVELFGHVQGAFPNTSRARMGRLEEANRSTLFLDAIDAAPSLVQHKLHRALETRQITPLGAVAPKTIDIRVIAASSADLAKKAESSTFLPSLLYRLNGLTLRLPPLRERREDLEYLFGAFLAEAAKRFERPIPKTTAGVLKRLRDHDWPGNVRELRKYAERNVLGLNGDEPPHLVATRASSSGSLKDRLAQYEAALIKDALRDADGQTVAAMETLQTPRKTFYDKVKKFGIDLKTFKS